MAVRIISTESNPWLPFINGLHHAKEVFGTVGNDSRVKSAMKYFEL